MQNEADLGIKILLITMYRFANQYIFGLYCLNKLPSKSLLSAIIACSQVSYLKLF